MKHLMSAVVTLFFLSFAAYAQAPLPGELVCYSASGITTSYPVVSVWAAEGAIHFDDGDSDYTTTRNCMARLNTAVSVRQKLANTVLDCLDPQGEVIYHAVVYQPVIVSGVWIWVEVSSGDSFVASIECESTGVVLP